MVKALQYQNPLLKPLSALMLPNIPNSQPSPVLPPPSFAPIRPLTPVQPNPLPVARPVPYPMRVPGSPLATPNFATLNPVNIPPQPESPIVSAAKGFYGGVNTGGELLSTLVGSILPFGDANLYSESGRANVLQRLQDSTFNPNTGEWFKAGNDAVEKVQADRGDFSKSVGNLTNSLLNATSFIPIGAGVNAAKSVGKAAFKDAAKEVGKSSLIGGGFSGAGGTADALAQGADLPTALQAGLEQVPVGLALGAGLPIAAKGVKIAGGKAVDRFNKGGYDRGSILIPGGKPSPEDAQYINKTVAEAKSPEQFRQDMIDTLWADNKKGKGVTTTLVENNPGEGTGYSGRITETNNGPLYQAFYKEYGRKPTKAAIVDMVDQHLGIKKTGDYKNLITPAEGSPFDSSIYSQLKDKQVPVPDTAPTPQVGKTATVVAKPDTLKSFGKTIEMTPKNGYEATKTADGGVVYKKTSLTGSNTKGDKSAVTNYYSSEGTKLTQAQHDAYIKGGLPTTKTKADVSEIGSPKPVPTSVKTTTKNPLAPGAKASKVVPQEVPTVENVGTAKTGEKGKSTAKVSKGRVYEKTSVAASKGRGAIEADKTSYDKFVKTVDPKSVPTTKQADTARALQEKFTPGTPEHKALGKIAGRNVTEAAQTLATIEKNVRKKATAKQMTTKFANKLYTILDDDRTVNKATFKPVEKANREFEVARNAKDKAYNKFQADPSEANARAFERANQNFTKADVKSLFEEYNTVAKAIKDSKTKNADAKKYRDTLKENSGIYFMDYVDSNLLSSTRVMINNYVNTLGVGAEEALFGKAGAAIARKLVPTATVGGGSVRGQIMGAKIGVKETISEAKLRQGAHQNAFTKTISNFTTTGNTLGDHNITGVAYSAAYDAYRQGLKAKGYKGSELNRRAKVATLADIEGKVPEAKQQALADVGLASMFDAKSRKIESIISDKLASKIGLSVFADSGVAKAIAKTFVRVTVGFPTVVIRGAIGGAKRTTLGVPTAIHAAVNALAKGDPNVTARLIKNSVKEFGSGATMIGTGYALGSTGLITGAYPADQDQRDAWKREGKTDYSINIGGDWYNLPQALGVFALPFMVGANAHENVKNGKPVPQDILETTWDTLLNLSPTDQLKTTIDLIQNGGDSKIASLGSSVAKAVTPLGSLLNQLAKAFDPTANDTTKGDAVAQLVSKVRDGLPIANIGLPDKTFEGKVITNPNPLARMLGAVSAEQKGGAEATQAIQNTVIAANKQLTDNGAFSNDIRNLMPDDATKALFDDIKSGKNTDPTDSKKIHEAIAKNVTATEDTRFLEDGNYDANIAVLKTKRDLLAADPTTRRDALNAYDAQIARGQVYKDNKTPYELTQDYSKTSLSEWRKMGDPEADEYNPEKYQALWDLDNNLAAAGGSRNADDPKANKFSAKKSGSGGGSGGGKANAKASANALLAAAKGSPTAKLPAAPIVKQAVYRPVPVSGGSPASVRSKFAPITISARSKQSKKA